MEKVCVIISITSDIGAALAQKYASDGYKIVGTYRTKNNLRGLKDCHLYPCDIDSRSSIIQFTREFRKLGVKWDTFISCPCNPLPLKSFFESNFDEWSKSIHTNAIEQLRVLHGFHPYRDKKAKVVFFAGGGVNNSVLNFSAYTVSKIMLIKMCEFLDAENKDLNIFIVGPGWTRTKNHKLILENVDHADPRYQQTIDFLSSDKGTSMDDIYGCIRWLSEQGKEMASGRNFSVVNDKWKGELSEKLAQALRSDPNMYKLRRYKTIMTPFLLSSYRHSGELS